MAKAAVLASSQMERRDVIIDSLYRLGAFGLKIERTVQMMGALYVVAAGCFWGSSGTLQSFAPTGATPVTIGAVRVCATGMLLFAMMMIKDARGFLRGPWPLFPVLLAAFGLTLYQLVFFTAVRLTGAGIASIIAIGSAPVMAGILGRVVFRERLGTRWVVSTALAIGGGVLIVSGGMEGAGAVDLTGVLLALLAGFAYALEGVGVKMIGGRRSPLEAVTAIFIASALLGAPFLVTPDAMWILTWRGLLLVVVLSVVVSALPFFLFSKGLLIVGVARSYTLGLSEPIMAWLLSTFLLGQKLAPVALAGVATICFAIVLLASGMRREPS